MGYEKKKLNYANSVYTAKTKIKDRYTRTSLQLLRWNMQTK